MTQESSMSSAIPLAEQAHTTPIQPAQGAGADTAVTSEASATSQPTQVPSAEATSAEHTQGAKAEASQTSGETTAQGESEQSKTVMSQSGISQSDQSKTSENVEQDDQVKSGDAGEAVSGSKVEAKSKIELSAAPQAAVGTIEVDGLQIEMVSLSQIREQNLALEQAQAEAKAAAKRKRSSTDTSKRTRKPKANKVEAESSTTPAEPTPEESASKASVEAAPETAFEQQVAVNNSAENTEATNTTESLATGSKETTTATQVKSNTSADKAEAESTESAEAESAEPSLAQTLLSQLISNVEQQEIKASQVSHEDMEKAADAATQQQEREQGKDNSQGQESKKPKKVLTSTEPEWADMDELTPEQIEMYSHMGLQEGDICPLCSNGILMMRHSYKSDFLGCSNFPSCNFHLYTGKRSPVVTLRELNSFCPECHGQLEVKKGRFGIFIGCSNYPACTYVYRRKDEAPVAQITCPICHEGFLVERRGRSGKSFYGCNNFPTCTFSLFGIPVEEKCEECGFPVMYQKKVKNGIALMCGDPNCPSHKKRKHQMLKTE